MTEKTSKIKKASNNKLRFLLFGASTAFFLLIGLIYGLYWLLISRFYESTNNAYVNGNIIPITTSVAGNIVSVLANNTQFVAKGQPLVQLDPIDAQVALDNASANLRKTIRNTQQLFINNHRLKANLIQQEIKLKKAREDMKRRQQAIGIGAVSKEELSHAADTLQSNEAGFIAARASLASNQALTEQATLAKHPQVLAAAAMWQKAFIDYERTKILAPISGEIASRTAEIGARVSANTQLMTLVPLNQLWVEANFKESQLRRVRTGQPVLLTADIYGSSVKYHGKIIGFSAGTGSAFALLPAQNATGNWIKVVQRLPIRIALNASELKAHPLRIGLSMEAEVDTHNQQGNLMSIISRKDSTKIFDSLSTDANTALQDIMQETIEKIAMLDPGSNTQARQHQ